MNTLIASTELDATRERIEAIDRQLVELLAERVRLARRVGELKRRHDLPVLDPAREAAVVTRAVRFARQAGLPTEPVRDTFWQVIGLCRRAQAE